MSPGMPVSFACWVAWLAGTSWVGMTLLQAGRFSSVAAVAGGLVFAAVVGVSIARIPGPASRASLWIVALSLALSTTLLPSIDTTLLSQDASVHRAGGRWLAREGRIAIPDPTLEIVEPRPSTELELGQLGDDDATRQSIASICSLASGFSGWTARVIAAGQVRTGFSIAKRSS